MPQLTWDLFFDAVEEGMTLRERLSATAAVAARRFDTAAFEEFCEKHLGHLEEVTIEFFGSDLGRDAVRQKVVALYPEEEVDEFTSLFWDRIQQWVAHTTAPASG